MIKAVKSKTVKDAKLKEGIKQSNVKGGVKFTVEETKETFTLSSESYKAFKDSTDTEVTITITGNGKATVKLDITNPEPAPKAKKATKAKTE